MSRRPRRLGNYLKTAVLLAGLTALVLLVGERLGGPQGMLIAGAFVVVMNFTSFWFSDRIALALHRAQPIPLGELQGLRSTVARLSQRAGLPMPSLYLIPTETPNAFATGRNPKHAAVAVTSGILRLLTPRELEAVLAHELSHVQNRDILIGTVAATLAGMITAAARLFFWFGGMLGGGREREGDRGSALGGLAMLIVAPIAAMLLQLAISRSREYGADATGAGLTGDPEALASALDKLARGAEALPYDRAPTTASLFTVSPLTRGGLMSLFSTHPPIAERIRRLRELRAAGLTPWNR
ncbi:MAG: zinc metalloprotease HtpX [Myxococcaceae bacterium]